MANKRPSEMQRQVTKKGIKNTYHSQPLYLYGKIRRIKSSRQWKCETKTTYVETRKWNKSKNRIFRNKKRCEIVTETNICHEDGNRKHIRWAYEIYLKLKRDKGIFWTKHISDGRTLRMREKISHSCHFRWLFFHIFVQLSFFFFVAHFLRLFIFAMYIYGLAFLAIITYLRSITFAASANTINGRRNKGEMSEWYTKYTQK